MASSNKNFIIDNINKLIEYSGLSDSSLADMLNYSIRKFKYMKRGDVNLKLDDINHIADFFNINVAKLSKQDMLVNPNLRQKLYDKYKNNLEYKIHFEKKPSIIYAIRFILISHPLFEEPMEINQIKALLKIKGWEYRSTSLSQALSRQSNNVKISQHPTKKRTLVYSKRSSYYNS